MTGPQNTDQSKTPLSKFLNGKLVRRAAVLYLAATLFASWGYALGRFQVFPARYINKYYSEIAAFLKRGTGSPNPEIRKSKFAYEGFILRDAGFIDPGYLLLSRFSKDAGQDVVELVRLRDFKILHQWIPPLKEVLRRNNIKLQRELSLDHGSLLLKNGELVFLVHGTGLLVKIDRHSRVIWALHAGFHHSVELSHDGNLIVATQNQQRFIKLPFKMWDQGYAVITQEGREIRRFSAAKILKDNGYGAFLFGTGRLEGDRMHLNDAQPIDRNTGGARIGDVALSLRNLSTVLLFRPSTGKIVWLKTGPWLQQHDVNLLEDGRYSVFGNDVYRFDNDNFKSVNGISNIYLYDPVTDQVKKPFTPILRKTEMFSKTQGRCRILLNGDAFIEETDASRILRISKGKVRWEYVNGVTKTTVGALHWSRYLAAEEFQKIKLDLWE